MNKSKMSTSDLLYQCSLRINNSINDSAILSAVSQFGYIEEKLNVGKDLLNEAEQLVQLFDKEYGDVDEAFAQRNAQQEKASAIFIKPFKVAKIAFKNDAAAQVALQLSGRRAVRFSKWLTQTKSFYNNLLANAQWLEVMAGYGITAEALTAGLEEVTEVESLNEVVMREKGDAQSATVARDNKLEELYEWVSDYEEIAKIALMDNEQLLEKLGIVVKN
jgi:hypothetical protein